MKTNPWEEIKLPEEGKREKDELESLSENEDLDIREERVLREKENEEKEEARKDEYLRKIKKRIMDVLLLWQNEVVIKPVAENDRRDPGKRAYYEKKKTSNLGYLEEFPSMCYSSKEIGTIGRVVFKLREQIDLLSKEKGISFEDSNLTHMLSNGPFFYFALAKREIGNIDKAVVDDTKVGYSGFPRIKKSKGIWNKFILYLDYIGEVKNKEILRKEANSTGGYLEDFIQFYKKRIDKKNSKEAREIASGGLSRLDHFIFFSRLGARDQIGNESVTIKGINKINQPIVTQKEFEAEFGKLEDKDLLDKKVICEKFGFSYEEEAEKESQEQIAA